MTVSNLYKRVQKNTSFNFVPITQLSTQLSEAKKNLITTICMMSQFENYCTLKNIFGSRDHISTHNQKHALKTQLPLLVEHKMIWFYRAICSPEVISSSEWLIQRACPPIGSFPGL